LNEIGNSTAMPIRNTPHETDTLITSLIIIIIIIIIINDVLDVC